MGAEETLIGFTTIFLLFGTPLLLAIVFLVGWLIHSNRRTRQVERARDAYERLAREKLDVIKTAIAMGQSDEQIRELDERLERLIGTDKLERLLDPRNPATPEASAELQDADLLAEADRLRHKSGEKG